MAPGTNWLSFTLSPMEMLRSSSSPSDHNPSQFMSYDGSSTPHYFLDNFYSYNNNGCWSNINAKEAQGSKATTMGQNSFINPTENLAQPAAPKLEDFLGDNSCHTESNPTQDDSSLTHIYNHHHQSAIVASYFNDPQELKAITGFQAFSANSGSEVDDSLHTTELVRGGSELGFARNCEKGLSLGVKNDGNTNNNNGNDRLGVNDQVSVEKGIVISGEFTNCSKNNIVDTFGQRTSIYRGVTRHRWTGRYEAHLWDNSCRREGQARKGRQVYLGGYDREEKAARAYDLAALKYWGTTATTNFPVSNYDKELEEMKYVSRQEFIASLRRKSSGFSRGASVYRGVTRHHQQGRWQARIGRVAGNKDLYLGTFATEEEAAEAYDVAAIKFRGLNAVTNFEMSRYDVEAIMKSALPVGGAGKRLKLSLEADQKPVVALDQQPPLGSSNNGSNNLGFTNVQPLSTIPCAIPFDATSAFYHHTLFQNFHPVHNFPALESLGSPSLSAPMAAVVPQTTEFFVWPHHQSY